MREGGRRKREREEGGREGGREGEREGEGGSLQFQGIYSYFFSTRVDLVPQTVPAGDVVAIVSEFIIVFCTYIYCYHCLRSLGSYDVSCVCEEGREKGKEGEGEGEEERERRKGRRREGGREGENN